MKKKAGFTLIELLVVITMIGLIASIVVPKLFHKIKGAKQNTAQAQIEALCMGLDAYYLDIGTYPSEEDGFAVLLQPKPVQDDWDGPYLNKEPPNDPWGNPYIYKCPGENKRPYEIISYGRDGKPGGEDEDTDVLSYKNLTK